MLHATGGARFTAKALLCRLISHESLTENFQRDGTINQQMRRTIDSPHAATAQALVQTILAFKRSTYEWIDGNIRDRGVGLQRRVIARAHEHIIRKLPAASWALKHNYVLESL